MTVHNGKNQKSITAPISKTIPVAITAGEKTRSTLSALHQILRPIVFIKLSPKESRQHDVLFLYSCRMRLSKYSLLIVTNVCLVEIRKT